jgi:hypothetical protein
MRIGGIGNQINMLDKLYYIFHSSVKSGFGQAERASFLLSASITLYGYSLYFGFVILVKSTLHNTASFYFLFGSLGISIIYGVSRYFVGTGRYRRIIEKYGSPRSLSKATRFTYRVLSIGVFFLGSLTAFIISAIALSKYLGF